MLFGQSKNSFYRVFGIHFKGIQKVLIYDTMANCLKNEIGISRAIFNGEYRGWLIGVK